MITKMFPEINEVFEEDNPELKKYFFPICTVDLSKLNPTWSDTVHFLMFNEDPYNEETVPFFNHYCEDNSIGFKIIDGKLKLLTDIRFMHVSKKWEEWLDKTTNTYYKSKEEYKNGELNFDYKSVINLGGTPEWLQYDETPSNDKGEKLHFIGQFESSDFTDDYCPKDVYVFYDPNKKILVQRYQIT